MTAAERSRFAERCREAGVDDRRFIDVLDGEKGTRTPGHQNPENWHAPGSHSLSGNYGIHPGPGRDKDAPWLVEFDIDDYDRERDRSALEELPETLAVKSPHTDPDDPGHRYYAVTGDVVAALREVAGNLNPEPVWGEVKSQGKYVVGPGSQLDGCTKEWCDKCAEPDGGYYTIAADVPIATITADELANVLRDDLDIQGRTGSGGHTIDEDGEIDGRGWVGDEAEPPEDLPMCYRAALAARGGGASVSKHKVNVYIGLLGLNCGYEVPEVVDHIREVDPGIDVSETEYHLEHIKENRYSPPALRTLDRAGIIPAPICHGECPIHGNRSTSGEGGSGKHERVAVVPNAPVSLAVQNIREWDWRAAGSDEGSDDLSIDSARQRTREAIADAYEHGDHVLIEALPTMGKSFSAIAAAADTGGPVSYLTNRGNDEQYQCARDRCERFGLSYYTLPSVWRDCPCFRGDHGDGVQADVRRAYNQGATAKEIHIHATDYLGYEIPCQHEDETCRWRQKWGFDAEDYDVLIGHYSHAHVSSVTLKRVVAFDEFPGDTFETQLGGKEEHRDAPLSGPVSHFLKNTPGLTIDDYADLMAARGDTERRADALGWFLSSEQPGRDAELAFGHGGHALAPLAAFVLLAGARNDFGNGWERVELSEVGNEGWIGLYNREENAVQILETPSFGYSKSVVALDGTPTRQMWESALGTRFSSRQVLADAERVEYLRDVLGHRYVRTTEWIKPYSSGEHVFARDDAALLDWIREEYARKPALITTQNAKQVYDADESVEFALDDEGRVLIAESCVSAAKHYGNLLGSNDFKRERLGAVVGSRHLGDGFVKKWAAYANQGTERANTGEGGKGTNLRYTGIGNAIHRHMTEHQTLQAAMRFGRDGNGAVVFVHTNTLPEWVEPVVESEGRVVHTRSKGERQVLAALVSPEFLDSHPDGWTTADVAAFPGVEISARQVRTHLHRLARSGYLDVEIAGNGFVWRDDGLHRVNQHGEVELAPVELDNLTNKESAEVSRTFVSTWNFRTSSLASDGSAAGSVSTDRSTSATVADGVDRPPDDLV